MFRPLCFAQAPTLLSLPQELVQNIGDELDISAVKQLRLTCKDLASYLSDRAFRALTIQVTRDNTEKDLVKLKALSTGKHPACYAARDLYIGSLVLIPAYNERGPPVGTRLAAEEIRRLTMAEECMSAHLFDAIASLKGVQTIMWLVPTGQASDHIRRTVMDSLKTLANLHCFSINFGGCNTPLELDSLTGLQELSLVENSEICGEDILERFAKMVAQNPTLSMIGLLNNGWFCHFPRDKFRSLHQLFKYYPTGAPPLRLHHLRLRGCLVRLDEITMPHLKHLTSLSLTCVEDPLNPRPPCYSVETHKDEGPMDRKRYGSTLDDIWNALHAAPIHLEAITVDVDPHSFLDYLSSYSGVKMLKLTANKNRDYYDKTSSDAMETRLFDVLSRHARSIEDLQILAETSGLLCFGSHNVELISKCINLKSIKMSVMPQHLEWDRDGQEAQKPATSFASESNVRRLLTLSKNAWQRHSMYPPELNIITLLLDTVVLYMPNIKTVQIAGATHDGSPPHNPQQHVRGFVDRRWFIENVLEQMKRNVSDYTASPSCQRLPSLTLKCYDSQRAWPQLLYEGEKRLSHTGVACSSNEERGLQGYAYVGVIPQLPYDPLRGY